MKRSKGSHHPHRYICGHTGTPFAKGNKLGIKFWNGNTIGLEHASRMSINQMGRPVREVKRIMHGRVERRSGMVDTS
jgi:hypothetical protein